MARKRASMREGPLAELFRATEAAQRQAEQEGSGAATPEREEPLVPPISAVPAPPPVGPPVEEPSERTVEHVPTWEEEVEERYEAATPAPPTPRPDPTPTPPAPEPPTPSPDPGPGFPSPAPDPAPPPPEIRRIEPPPLTRYMEPRLPE